MGQYVGTPGDRGGSGSGSGDGSSSGAINLRPEIGDWTIYDPNSLLVVNPPEMTGQFIRPKMRNHGVVSGTPKTGVSFSALIKNLKGEGDQIDIFQMLGEISGWTLDDDPPCPDACVGWGVADGPIQTAQNFMAAALIASGTDWKARKIICVGGVETVTDASAVSPLTVGSRLLLFNTSSSVQRGCSVAVYGADGESIATSNLMPGNTNSANMSSAMTHVFGFAGWTGTLGTGVDNTFFTLRPMELVSRLNDLENSERTRNPQ
jgi:hypothetical protein